MKSVYWNCEGFTQALHFHLVLKSAAHEYFFNISGVERVCRFLGLDGFVFRIELESRRRI